jgi:anti-anti-sigma factor
LGVTGELPSIRSAKRCGSQRKRSAAGDFRGGSTKKENMAAEDPAREYRLVVGIDREGSSLAVRAVGELDIATAPVLEESIREALDQPETESVVVDLSGAGVMDPTGLEVLRWADPSQAGGRRVRIRGVSVSPPAAS